MNREARGLRQLRHFLHIFLIKNSLREKTCKNCLNPLNCLGVFRVNPDGHVNKGNHGFRGQDGLGNEFI